MLLTLHVVVLEPEDVARVFTAVAKWYPDQGLAVRVLFYTGMREGELLGLQWSSHQQGRATDPSELVRHQVFRSGLKRGRFTPATGHGVPALREGLRELG